MFSTRKIYLEAIHDTASRIVDATTDLIVVPGETTRILQEIETYHERTGIDARKDVASEVVAILREREPKLLAFCESAPDGLQEESAFTQTPEENEDVVSCLLKKGLGGEKHSLKEALALWSGEALPTEDVSYATEALGGVLDAFDFGDSFNCAILLAYGLHTFFSAGKAGAAQATASVTPKRMLGQAAFIALIFAQGGYLLSKAETRANRLDAMKALGMAGGVLLQIKLLNEAGKISAVKTASSTIRQFGAGAIRSAREALQSAPIMFRAVVIINTMGIGAAIASAPVVAGTAVLAAGAIGVGVGTVARIALDKGSRLLCGKDLAVAAADTGLGDWWYRHVLK